MIWFIAIAKPSEGIAKPLLNGAALEHKEIENYAHAFINVTRSLKMIHGLGALPVQAEYKKTQRINTEQKCKESSYLCKIRELVSS